MPMMPTTASTLKTYGLRLGAIALALLISACLFFVPTPARAQSCWVQGAASLNFGIASAQNATDAQTRLTVNCQASFGSAGSPPTYFRVCVFVGEGTPTGIAPRRLINYQNNTYLNYDLYSDPARTQLLGPFSSTFPVYSTAIAVADSTTQTVLVPIYGRIRAGQTVSASQQYQGQPTNSEIRYSYSHAGTPSESNCRNTIPVASEGAGIAPFAWSSVDARYENICRITTTSDMDFGVANALTTTHDQTSTIKLQCPIGTLWLVNLNNGANASGNTRRMASGNNRIAYELYTDAARQNRWGNTTTLAGAVGFGTNGTQTLTVYGRILAQPNTASGTYVDTITVTLTY